MTAQQPEIPIEILLVDDDPGDVRLTREALKDGKVSNVVHVAEDGAAALAFLRGEPPYPDARRPDLILLDLNMPKKDGKEVLAEVKADPGLRRIPVVVLTTSEAEQDVAQSYDLHANAYVRKPIDLEQFIRAVQSIDEFFVSVVRLPGR
jgi:two-component system, chemotaxis family, response regulator Rcp1